MNMATNIYDREETVSFDPANPCHYYGWRVTTSSDDFSITGFHFKELREAFLRDVAKLLARRNMKADAEYVGALAFAIYSEGFDDAEFASTLLDRELDGYRGHGAGEVDENYGPADFYEEYLKPICEKFNEKDNEQQLAETKRRVNAK
jgi:hypothetical protein